MISAALITTNQTKTYNAINLKDMPHQFKWNEQSKEAFSKALTLPPIQTLINTTKTQLENSHDTDSINTALQNFNGIVLKTAELSLKHKNNSTKNKQKPWHTGKLKKMEKDLQKKATDMIQQQTGETRRKYYLALKLYRKERKYTIRHYRNNK